jgi:hypothetical protein
MSDEWLRPNFEQVFELPPDAVDWLMDLWDAIQFFDDIADGDETSRADLDKVLWSSLIGMHMNRFYAANSTTLSPIVASMILKWQASDDAERAGQADERSYMWRAGYYDVVLMVVHLCHGYDISRKAARDVMRLYGETFKEYREEFPCQVLQQV